VRSYQAATVQDTIPSLFLCVTGGERGTMLPSTLWRFVLLVVLVVARPSRRPDRTIRHTDSWKTCTRLKFDACKFKVPYRCKVAPGGERFQPDSPTPNTLLLVQPARHRPLLSICYNQYALFRRIACNGYMDSLGYGVVGKHAGGMHTSHTLR
jgi:hypothetical protein